MKILLICYDFYWDSQTGAATQANETCRILREAGHSVERVYSAVNGGKFLDENGQILTENTLADSFRACDVVHLIPCSKPILRAISRMPKKPIFGSTIFWSGIERGVVCASAKRSLGWKIRCLFSAIAQMVPLIHDFRAVDVFIPNTNAEAKRVSSSYRTSKKSRVFPVPNGFHVPGFGLDNLPRSPDIPKDDYIIVPGIFAPRKNQLGVIRALKGFGLPVVFLGGKNPSSQWYYDVCRRESDGNMFFVDYKPSASKEYWSLLKYARCACLPSDCETPGIAMLEAAYAGARPAITKFGGTIEYFGFDAEYFNPCSQSDIREAIVRAWERGRLSDVDARSYSRFSWEYCARLTMEAYSLKGL